MHIIPIIPPKAKVTQYFRLIQSEPNGQKAPQCVHINPKWPNASKWAEVTTTQLIHARVF